MLALVTACGFTPVPEPPALDPPDLEEITLFVDSILPPTPDLPFDILGDVGAAEPGATVWIVNFDLPYPPYVGVVGEDGSFRVGVLGNSGHELRIQLRQDDLRSEPLDVALGSIVDGARLSLVEREGCITIAPELDLGNAPVGETTTGQIIVENRCAAELLIDRIEPRGTLPDLDAIPPPPITIAPSSASPIDIRFTPSEAGDLEEIFFIYISSPVAERRAVTVFGRAIDD